MSARQDSIDPTDPTDENGGPEGCVKGVVEDDKGTAKERLFWVLH
jgi:hypothetical protein